MAPPGLKKRKVEEGMNGKISRPKKKIRKQAEYHSSSSEDEDGVPKTMSAVNKEPLRSRKRPQKEETGEEEEEELDIKSPNEEKPVASRESPSEDEEDSDASSATSHSSAGSTASSNLTSTADRKKISKRNDPTALSTSISKILSTKLPSSARSDPLLSRSKSAAQTSTDIANEKLERRARAKLRAEKKEGLERDRIKDVLGIQTGESGETAEREKRLRKVAQRGVVKLFNAVRAAQVRGEEVAREERQKRSTVGMGEREKKVNEVSKQGFLDLINGKGGKVNIEEA